MSLAMEAGFAEICKHEPGDTLPFYQVEGKTLGLWDQLHELKLEQALLQAQISLQSEQQPIVEEFTEEHLKDAEREYVKARAAYYLRQSVVEDVLIADPTLNAVHAGENATFTERNLHPLIDRRDALALAQANLSSSLQSVLRDTTIVEVNTVKATEKNKALTATLHDICSKTEALRNEVAKVSSAKAELDQVREDSTTARNRWRIMKSVVGAVIAGSGVDWARNDELRDLVLDSEDERG